VGVSVVALRCRTADRFPGAPRGVELLAPLVGNALGVEPRFIGSAGGVRETTYEEDLRDARGCLLEAGGQVDDALAAGDTPVILAADCSVSVTTLPAAMRNRPEARILWLDAHGDYNTPDTSGSG
jgi:arginase